MEPLSPAVESLQQLIAFPSISSTSNGAISQWVGDQLRSLGFEVEITSYRDPNQVEKFNVVGRRDPASAESQREGLAYFCHTDVVPVGDWTGPGGEPFQGVVDADRLYGRGSCDMKGSLAAMMTAAAQVSPDEQRGPLWIVCTADEEVGFLGAKQLRKHSEAYHHLAQQQPVAIIGEPTRLAVVNAHKGIIGLQITSRGRAAHSSTTDGINANVAMVPMLQTLLQLHEKSLHETCYHDGRFDPPYLSWNFGVSDHNAAINVTPEKSVAWVSLRPMPHISGADLVQAARERAEQLGLEFRIIEGGSPFWVEPDEDFVQELCQLSHSQPKTVCYGTDGGEFQELKRRIVFGPGDIAQAHTADEWIELAQLQHGVEMYRRAIQRWCGAG